MHTHAYRYTASLQAIGYSAHSTAFNAPVRGPSGSASFASAPVIASALSLRVLSLHSKPSLRWWADNQDEEELIQALHS